MKKFRYFFLALAALSFAAVSCQTEEEPFEPGEPDVAGCYGVYFPIQEATGDHTFTPSDPTVSTFTVARKNPGGAISVPVVISTESSGVFTVAPISFADGQSETTFDIDFSGAELGKKYSISVQIDDPQYVSKYNDAPIAFDFSVFRVEWKKFATGTFFCGWQGSYDYDVTMYYYEDGDVYQCYVSDVFGSLELEPRNYYFSWNPKTGEVLVPHQYLYTRSSDGLDVYFGDNASFYSEYYGANYWDGNDNYSGWADYAYKNGWSMPYYNGNGDFYLADQYYLASGGAVTGSGWWDQTPDMFIADGFIRTDYNIKALEADFSKDGELPVYLYVGTDVTKADFVVVAGELTATQVGNQVSAIEKGTAENVNTLEEFVEAEYDGKDAKAAAAAVALPETGTYTIVAVTYNDKGEIADYASLVTKFVASGDEEANAVDLTCGIGSAAKYAGQGVNTDTALEVWAYGTDIVDAKAAAVKYTDLVSDFEGVLAAVKESDSLDADVVEAINGDGFVAVADRLLPGTQYYFVVWASNGFSEGYFISEDPCYTTGDPLPIYQNFAATDIDWDITPTSSEGYFGKYNLYAVDVYGDLGLREYLGKVPLSDSEIPDDPWQDDEGNEYIDEYIDVAGLFQGDADYYGFDNSAVIISTGGELYFHTPQYLPALEGGYGVMLVTITSADPTSYYRGDIMLGGMVDDGYIAFCCPTSYLSYGFSGIGGLAFAGDDTEFSSPLGWAFKYNDLLLVDETKDDNGVAPKAGKPSFVRTETVKAMGRLSRSREVKVPYALPGVKVSDSFKDVAGECPVKTVEVKTSALAPKANVSSNRGLLSKEPSKKVK